MKHIIEKLFFISLLISFISCTDEIEDLGLNSNQILVFETKNEYEKAISESVKIPYDELESWAKSKGIKSHGVEAVKIYTKIDFDAISSKEEFMSIIDKNREHLILKEVGHELFLETKYHDVPNRFLINEDKLVQVKDKVYKIFPNGELVGSSRDIESLKSITQEKFNQFIANDLKIVGRLQIKSKKKADSKNLRLSNYGQGVADTEINGKNMTTVTATLEEDSGSNCYYSREKNWKVRFLVRPYKKSWGAWVYCRRTITSRGKCTVYEVPYYSLHSESWPYEQELAWKREAWQYVGCIKGEPWFGKVWGYGDTPSTAPAEFNYY